MFVNPVTINVKTCINNDWYILRRIKIDTITDTSHETSNSVEYKRCTRSSKPSHNKRKKEEFFRFLRHGSRESEMEVVMSATPPCFLSSV